MAVSVLHLLVCNSNIKPLLSGSTLFRGPSSCLAIHQNFLETFVQLEQHSESCKGRMHRLSTYKIWARVCLMFTSLSVSKCSWKLWALRRQGYRHLCLSDMMFQLCPYALVLSYTAICSSSWYLPAKLSTCRYREIYDGMLHLCGRLCACAS